MLKVVCPLTVAILVLVTNKLHYNFIS